MRGGQRRETWEGERERGKRREGDKRWGGIFERWCEREDRDRGEVRETVEGRDEERRGS